MPIHDWTRVNAGIFHSFHPVWIAEIQRYLNAGLLPPDYYALAEQVAGGMGPDVPILHTGGTEPAPPFGGRVTVAEALPRVRFIARTEVDQYALKQKSLVIRHSSDHRIIAMIEILSPGNKSSRHAIRSLLEKALTALKQGIHLLILDLSPPGPRDPQGVHGLI